MEDLSVAMKESIIRRLLRMSEDADAAGLENHQQQECATLAARFDDLTDYERVIELLEDAHSKLTDQARVIDRHLGQIGKEIQTLRSKRS